MTDYKFTGSIKGCVEHLRGELERQPEKWEEVSKTFAGISQRKLKRWMNGDLPNGQSYIKFMYLFEAMGYHVDELSKLPKEVYLFGKETFGTGMQIEEIKALLGPEFQTKMIYEYFRGEVKPPGLKLEIMKGIYETRPDQKKEAIAQASAVATSCENSESVAMKKSTIMEYFCYLIKMATPLAEALMSDNFSADERRKIREDVGRNEFFRLSLLIDGLSSEEARKNVFKDLNSQLQKGAK